MSQWCDIVTKNTSSKFSYYDPRYNLKFYIWPALKNLVARPCPISFRVNENISYDRRCARIFRPSEDLPHCYYIDLRDLQIANTYPSTWDHLATRNATRYTSLVGRVRIRRIWTCGLRTTPIQGRQRWRWRRPRSARTTGNTTFCDAVQLSPNHPYPRLPPHRPHRLRTRSGGASPCLLLPPPTVYPFVHSSERTHPLPPACRDSTDVTSNREEIRDERLFVIKYIPLLYKFPSWQ